MESAEFTTIGIEFVPTASETGLEAAPDAAGNPLMVNAAPGCVVAVTTNELTEFSTDAEYPEVVRAKLGDSAPAEMLIELSKDTDGIRFAIADEALTIPLPHD